MIEIISGTNRPGSKTLEVTKKVNALYQAAGASTHVIDLHQLNLSDVADGDYIKGAKGTFKEAVDHVTNSEGVVIVIPEYNGSYPGILKLFIDYWHYPKTFEHRPIALIGLGTRWGGLRPVEHLQQVLGYRNGFVFPNRVFISHVRDVFKDGNITDPLIEDLLQIQAREFIKFIAGLKSQELDANSKLKNIKK